jgi:sugar phosphate permease
MVFSLLPVFLKTELGYSNTRIGTMEGAALLMSNLSRVISGVMSDITKSRVKVIALGSAMTAAMKLVLAGAVTPQWVGCSLHSRGVSDWSHGTIPPVIIN